MKPTPTPIEAPQPTDPGLVEIVEGAIARLQAGEAVDVDKLADAYPQLADELRELLPTVQQLMQLGERAEAPLSDAPFDAAAGAAAGSTYAVERRLGDFRILGEIGRGGMGIVYEAEQISLGRRVALKVLPFAAMLDKQQLARFKNEARAAATLDHPNIVAVYSVGAERGVHYYSMQLVDGESLAHVIARLASEQRPGQADPDATTPAPGVAPPLAETVPAAALTTLRDGNLREHFRTVASYGMQAAEALDHAHRNGIVHRDVKPANLLVDDSGKLWVTDFGLARFEGGAGMSMTGDLLGTLRYMSPEQALAKRAVVDHRSDVYSLGVTLYELLTLQPAFPGDDRQQVLQRIALEEPPRPRQLNRLIPVDLETIIAKAIEKDPADRYATALDLADDLRRFHDDRSIRAKAPSLAQRARRWSRRHSRAVAAAAGACALMCVVLAAGIAAVQHAQRRTQTALEETSALLYTADMTLAYQAYAKGWFGEAQEILDQHRPAGDETDRRGFEWRLLQRLVQPPASFALEGHRGEVAELAVFPDRRRLASVGADGALRIWDLQARRLLRTIDLSGHGLSAVAVSPDGRYVAAGSTGADRMGAPLTEDLERRLPPISSTTVYLCDLDADYQVAEIYPGRVTVESLAFSADGGRLAVGTRYDEVCVLTLDGTVINRTPTSARTESLEFLPQERALLAPYRTLPYTLASAGVAQLWRDDLSRVEQALDCSNNGRLGHVSVARSLPNSNCILAGDRDQRQAHLLELKSGRVVDSTSEARGRINDLATSPAGDAAAIAFQDGSVECFAIDDRDGELKFRQPSRVIAPRQGEVLCVRFVSQGQLATCGADGSIRVWSLDDLPARPFNTADQQIEQVRLSPDGNLLLETFRLSHQVVDGSTGSLLHRLEKPSARNGPSAWSPAGDRYAVCLTSGHVHPVRVFRPDGELLYAISHPGDAREVQFSPSGRLLAVIGDRRLQLCRADDGATLSDSDLPGEGLAIAFSSAGDRIAYGGMFGQVILRPAPGTRQTPKQTIQCGIDTRCLAFSPDDSLLASGHGDGVVRLWDPDTGRLRARLVGHEGLLRDIAFSPDGRTLLTSALDGTARVWSVDYARCYGVFYSHQQHGRREDVSDCRLSLSADGRRLALGYRTDLPEEPEALVVTIDSPAN